MNKYNFRKNVMALLLILFISSNAYAQGILWEYVRTYDQNETITPNLMQSMTELESGDIIVNASWRDKSVNGTRSENPGLMRFSADGTLQKEVYWSRFGYRSDDQYIIESPDHNIIVMGHFLPDRDPNAGQFTLEGSDKAYLYFYKLDNEFNMIDSVEYLLPLDTTNNAAFYQAGTWQYPNISMAKIKLTSSFVEDGCIVGSYTKTQTRYNNYALDSLFFFKMDFDGNFLVHKGISLGDRGSDPYAFNDQMISNAIGYVHYHSGQNNAKNIGDHCVLVDKEFNYVKTMGVDVLPYNGPRYIDFELVRKSPWGTTFLSCLIDYDNKTYCPNPLLMEVEENNAYVHVLRRKEAVSFDYDMTALRSPACFTDDGTIWAYTRDRGLYRNHDSWIMIEKLNRDFGLEREVYYPYQERTNLNCNSYIVSRDGGVLLLSYCHELDKTNVNHYILTKFPAEAFVGIDEAHDCGLKVAIAYPNPGKDVLNIRTGLRDAWVEVYDSNGRLIHSQSLTENVTGIDAGGWAEGVYVWKVMTEGKEVECGKWVKE